VPRKRKVNYPPPKTATRRAPAPGLTGDAPFVRPTLATIDLTARAGKGDLQVGDRVRITGSGLLAGETVTVETQPTGVIPAVLVRSEDGRTRRVRTIDLEPVVQGRPATADAPDEDAAPAS
jgi:hypothetical protein